MKVLVATAKTQRQRTSDFCWTEDGELVGTPFFECERDDDDVCGCKRSFSGFVSLKSSTTAVVEDRPINTEQLMAAARESLKKGGWDKAYSPGKLRDLAHDLAVWNLRNAILFEPGTVVERHGDRVTARKPAHKTA